MERTEKMTFDEFLEEYEDDLWELFINSGAEAEGVDYEDFQLKIFEGLK